MRKSNFCTACKVDVSGDLKYCPLCGRFVLDDENSTAEENENSYPNYDLSYIYKAKWLKLVKDSLILVSLVALAVNLLFNINCIWFPYVFVGLYCLWSAVYYPFKEGQNHIKRIPITGFILSIAVIFVDVYNHLVFDTLFGWGVIYTAPAILTASVVVSLIISLSTNKYDTQLIRGLMYLLIVSVVAFVVELIVVKNYPLWPIFMYFLSSTISVSVLMLAKRKRMVKEINRNFHI